MASSKDKRSFDTVEANKKRQRERSLKSHEMSFAVLSRYVECK